MEEIKESGSLESCTVGIGNKSNDCHSKTHVKRSGLKRISDISSENLELLRRRSGLQFSENDNICLHHEAILLRKYSFLQKTCCNPFQKEKHYVLKSITPISINAADTLNALTKSDIKPGQKLCITCRKEMKDKPKETLSSFSEDERVDVHTLEVSDALDTSFIAIGASPLKFQKIGKRDHISYGKRKIKDVQTKMIAKVANVGGIDPKSLNVPPSSSKVCLHCQDYKNLIEELREKLHISQRPQQIQILTLVPEKWSIKKVMEEFGVTEYMVRQARSLKAEKGILAVPNKYQGKKLSEEVAVKIKNFYEDDEFSRICPGMYDYVSVRIEGTKVKMPKRLLLSNVKELFIAYRERHGNEVGFSKFCELRPKWCVTVTSSGMHNICVCIIHQNVKLMLAATSINVDYKELVAKAVCNTNLKDCMLHRCEECLGEDGVQNYLKDIFKDHDPEELIVFKQWIHTDRDTLDTKQLSVHDYINDLSSKLWNLSTHHYIAKEQSKHLRTLKENLECNVVIILMDFAENYSFVVQDAVQGFHWENTQATLHPFVVYYKDNNFISNINICMISDCLKHDTIAVHVYLKKLIEYLKEILENITYIHYFSDGSTAQYKNYKNFINLCHHEEDFNIKAAWNFFATSHGKSPCDGIGGTAKRTARHASLQRTIDNQILTPFDLFTYCDTNVQKIKFFYIPKCDIESVRSIQEERFRFGHTLAGTRDNHYFVPIDNTSIRVHRVSTDNLSFIACIEKSPKFSTNKIVIQHLRIGMYVACIYDKKWWIGNVCETSTDKSDALITFMHPHGPAHSSYWPERKDVCWIPEQHFLVIIPAPSVTSSGRQYNIPEEIKRNIAEAFKLSG